MPIRRRPSFKPSASSSTPPTSKRSWIFWLNGRPKTMISPANSCSPLFLWEGAPEAALEQARAAGCSVHLWLEIARALEKENATDAVAIYHEQIDPVVVRTHNHAYDEATKLVERVRDLLARAERSADFVSWLNALRARHKAKRNFMKRLDRIAAKGPRAPELEE